MKKPILGEVAKLSDLFTDFKYCRHVFNRTRGSHFDHPCDYRFLAPGVPLAWRRDGSQEWVLHTKPVDGLLEKVQAYCCDRALASFEIIPWPNQGKALVLARDRAHIAAPWVAFIPLSEVPTAEFLLSLPLGDDHA